MMPASCVPTGAVQWHDSLGDQPEPEGHPALPLWWHPDQESAEAHLSHHNHRWGAHRGAPHHCGTGVHCTSAFFS